MKHSYKIQTASDYLNNRRTFLKGSLLMSAGLLLNRQTASFAAESAEQTQSQRSKVSFTAGKDRREMVNQVMTPFKDMIANRVRPNFTVIENLEGMEGDGPISGTPVEHGVALAGPDVMAVDSICAQLMDIPLENIGYLNYCASAGLGIVDRAKIDIIGDKKPQEYVKKYKLGGNIETQLKWIDPIQMQDEGGPFGSGGGGNRRNTGAGGARR